MGNARTTTTTRSLDVFTQAKKIVENALLSKLQEAQGQVEETKAELLLSRERGAALETDKTQQGAAIAALTKQLQEANRRDEDED